MIAYCIITSTGRHKKWGMLAAGWESWHYVTQGNVCIAALSQTSLKGGSEVSTTLIFRATFLGGVKSVLLLCVGIDQKASEHPPDPQILSLESPPLSQSSLLAEAHSWESVSVLLSFTPSGQGGVFGKMKHDLRSHMKMAALAQCATHVSLMICVCKAPPPLFDHVIIWAPLAMSKPDDVASLYKWGSECK